MSPSISESEKCYERNTSQETPTTTWRAEADSIRQSLGKTSEPVTPEPRGKEATGAGSHQLTVVIIQSAQLTCTSEAGPGEPAQQTSTGRRAGCGEHRSEWVESGKLHLKARDATPKGLHRNKSIYVIVYFYV